MKKRYSNSKIARIGECISDIIFFTLVFMSIWAPINNGKIFFSACLWVVVSICIFYVPEKTL